MALPYWRLSGFYFFYFAALGTYLPYWGLYLKQNGFSARQIGEIISILVATKIVAPYLWGWLADKTGSCLRLIRWSSALSAVSFAGFLYTVDYYWVALVTFCYSMFWNATLPQFEAATLLHLQTEPQRYSRVRLWGSVGFIAAVLGVGGLLEFVPVHTLPAVILALLAANWLTALSIPEVVANVKHQDQGSLWQLLWRPEVLAFFLVYLLLQISHGPYYAFYSLYLQQFHYSTTWTGLLWSLGVAAEILLFVWVAGILNYLSLRRLLLISLGLTVFRWWLIAYYPSNLPWVLIAQTLHAASFGIAHVVAMQLLRHYFGARHQGKGQALYASLSFGLGGMIGSFYSGYCWERLGGGSVFVIAALAAGVGLLVAYLGVGRQKVPALG
ncbi:MULTISPECIES: MFS transporter [Methylomonas]|uniref:MFS transporter n=1 Tax=Methylomonas TaxID=416 RepID=UPI0012328D5D|nr:MFS transporter [Methylomonas rhizoryzae]